MPNRSIKSKARASSLQLTDCLSSLFALELMHPSPEIYLISPWLSNVTFIGNRFGQFRAVMGDSGDGDLRLATILKTLAERGARVRVMYRSKHQQTEEFLNLLPENLERRGIETLHEKGLITRYFYLRGSMNFTYSGVNLNDESVELTTDAQDVALALLEAQQRWEALSL
jgi:phosphatidylserine/phosphatidylglycerophosphate/cardiolipin synthase-like enzyme